MVCVPCAPFNSIESYSLPLGIIRLLPKEASRNEGEHPVADLQEYWYARALLLEIPILIHSCSHVEPVDNGVQTGFEKIHSRELDLVADGGDGVEAQNPRGVIVALVVAKHDVFWNQCCLYPQWLV